MHPPIDHDLVLVVWEDANTGAGWMSVEEASRGRSYVVSVGFVLEEDERGIVLGTGVGRDWDGEEWGEAEVLGAQRIPRGMILERRPLRAQREDEGSGPHYAAAI